MPIFWMVWMLALWAASADAVTLRIRTVSGDTAFFAASGDTVGVAVDVDAEGAVLTGVELFLKYDPGLFEVVRPQGGLSIGERGGLLGTVLAEELEVVSDSLAVIHYAEADLSGKVASGRLLTVRLRVIGAVSGFSEIGLYRNETTHQVSAYTVPTVAGATFEFQGVRSLFYGDLPPVLLLPEQFFVAEDSVLVVGLGGLASDRESAGLVWQIEGPDSLVTVVLEGDAAWFVPAPDFNGGVRIRFAVTDGSGGTVQDERLLEVLPVNDAPEFLAGAVPDTVRLTGKNLVIDLRSAVRDADDEVDALAWSAESPGSVQVVIEIGPSARIFAPLDWTGAEVVVLRVSDPSGASGSAFVTVVREVVLNALPGDLDGNGVVAFPDFLIFVQAFGSNQAPGEADLDGDGRVDFSDFLIFAQNFGRVSQ